MERTGLERVAMLLMSLDPGTGGRILSYLPEELVVSIGREMMDLDPEQVSTEEIQVVATRFLRDLEGFTGLVLDPAKAFHDILRGYVGDERAREILQRVHQESEPRATELEQLEPKQIAEVLVEDHPQVLALVLSRMTPSTAAQVFGELPDERKADVLQRLAFLGKPSPDLVNRVVGAVASRVSESSETASITLDGIRNIARMLKCLAPEESRDLVGRIADSDEGLAKEIQDHLFTFEELKGLTRRDIQKVLSQINVETLALAIKGAEADIEETLLSNISKRVGEQVREEREILGPVAMTRVREAQATICAKVWEFVEKGEIVLRRAEEEQVV